MYKYLGFQSINKQRLIGLISLRSRLLLQLWLLLFFLLNKLQIRLRRGLGLKYDFFPVIQLD